MNKPDCYKCVHRRSIPGNAHSRCNNIIAKTKWNEHGVKMGWAFHPINFDPVWLETCDGFSDNQKDNKPEAEVNPLLELIAMLK